MSPQYLLKFWNSIILVAPIVVGQMAVSCLASYSFARYRRKRREILFFSYIILMLMPFQVTLVPNYMIADKLKILNTPWAIILPGIFSTFAIFLLTKYMRQIPIAYIEAAKLDGATEWQIFTQIAVPMCKSAIIALTILLFIDYWNMVEQPLVLLTDATKQPMSVFLSQINEKEIGIAFAASAVFMIPPLLIFLWGEEYLVEGISRSGVK
jgi:multiple sugar transport system permease protein